MKSYYLITSTSCPNCTKVKDWIKRINNEKLSNSVNILSVADDKCIELINKTGASAAPTLVIDDDGELSTKFGFEVIRDYLIEEFLHE